MSTEPYRPSNGTSGDIFCSAWCFRCKHDTEADPCPILTATLIYDIDDAAYPKEWVRDAGKPIFEGNPRCTAFAPIDEETTYTPDVRQIELPL